MVSTPTMSRCSTGSRSMPRRMRASRTVRSAAPTAAEQTPTRAGNGGWGIGDGWASLAVAAPVHPHLLTPIPRLGLACPSLFGPRMDTNNLMKHSVFFLFAITLHAQSSNEKLGDLLQDRALFEAVARMKTDDRIAMYETLANSKPEDAHYQNQMAATYLQKMRETMDPDYLNRAGQIVDNVLSTDRNNYEALRLKSAIELERHDFPAVERDSRRLIEIAPDDPWNWGTLGDSLMELGKYSDAADAYQTMARLRPDMSSYNRAAYYRFVAGDGAGAIEIMKRAIDAGSRSPENVAWCLVDLGNMDLKVGRAAEAEQAFQTALKLFPGYHPANAGLGRINARRGRTSEAIEYFTKAADVVPLPE